MIRNLLMSLACVVLFSCSDKKVPKAVLEPEKMQEVLWDVIRADVFTTDYISADTSKNQQVENVKMQKAIFEKYKITREDFYNSYSFYENHPGMMQVMLDTMINRKRRMTDSSHVKKEEHILRRDSMSSRRDSILSRRDSSRRPRRMLDTSHFLKK